MAQYPKRMVIIQLQYYSFYSQQRAGHRGVGVRTEKRFKELLSLIEHWNQKCTMSTLLLVGIQFGTTFYYTLVIIRQNNFLTITLASDLFANFIN
jgi:hypothetical protein